MPMTSASGMASNGGRHTLANHWRGCHIALAGTANGHAKIATASAIGRLFSRVHVPNTANIPAATSSGDDRDARAASTHSADR